MQIEPAMFSIANLLGGRMFSKRFGKWLVGGVALVVTVANVSSALAQTTNQPASPPGSAATEGGQKSDPLLDLMIKKGLITADEAQKVKAEAEASQANVAVSASKWKLGNSIKSIELYGDLRVRFEDRAAYTPTGDHIDLERYRYAMRLGLRGDLFDDFYFGVRFDTAANPRSPWVTFGTSTSGNPYQGPFGKSTAGINVGQLYIGWRPTSWLDLTVGKMPNPLYTTPMTWDTDLNPEGLAERFKYRIGDAELFATFGQFLYQDTNPEHSDGGLVTANLAGQDANMPFLLAWQIGTLYHLDKDTSFKAAVTLYNYTGQGLNSSPGTFTPDFDGTFVGEGSFLGPGSGTTNGASGFPNGGAFGNFDGFAFNQTGLNDLLVLDIPLEFNFKVRQLNARFFGDYAENLEGNDRATAAANAAFTLSSGAPGVPPPPLAISGPQKNENKAYQVGFAIGNKDSLGLVYGSTAKKNAWELRSYWQHIEQYALDPNLIDSDWFEGRGNLQGIYSAFAYGFTDGIIGTVRYGYAWRINKNLGTGGSNQDIPQVNPIDHYHILQADLTYRF